MSQVIIRCCLQKSSYHEFAHDIVFQVVFDPLLSISTNKLIAFLKNQVGGFFRYRLYYILSTTFLDFFACLCQAAQHVFSIKNQEAAANVEICTLTAGKKEYQIQKLSISYDICITRLYVRYILHLSYVTLIFKSNKLKKMSGGNPFLGLLNVCCT